MKILLTGDRGYIGTVMRPMLEAAGHVVTGLDTGFFADCVLGPARPDAGTTARDVRDLGPDDVAGFDAVIHLAALSNDPLGSLDPDLTYAINHRASVRLARLAQDAGVRRFLFASSCSLYGVQGDGLLDETAPFSPITAYGQSKVLVERDVSALATDDFSPVFLRNATAYGFSPRLRADVVVNNLVAYAVTTGEILIQSDGTPWRPLVHVRDFCGAFLAVLQAPQEAIHDQAFNVGRTAENYRVSDLAALVEAAAPGTTIRYAKGAGPDPRSYRVDCGKLEALPDYRPEWTVARGIAELLDAYRRYGLTVEEFLGDRYVRLKRIQRLRRAGRLDDALRWRQPAAAGGVR